MRTREVFGAMRERLWRPQRALKIPRVFRGFFLAFDFFVKRLEISGKTGLLMDCLPASRGTKGGLWQVRPYEEDGQEVDALAAREGVCFLFDRRGRVGSN